MDEILICVFENSSNCSICIQCVLMSNPLWEFCIYCIKNSWIGTSESWTHVIYLIIKRSGSDIVRTTNYLIRRQTELDNKVYKHVEKKRRRNHRLLSPHFCSSAPLNSLRSFWRHLWGSRSSHSLTPKDNIIVTPDSLTDSLDDPVRKATTTLDQFCSDLLLVAFALTCCRLVSNSSYHQFRTNKIEYPRRDD